MRTAPSIWLIPLSVCAILMLAACGSDESVSVAHRSGAATTRRRERRRIGRRHRRGGGDGGRRPGRERRVAPTPTAAPGLMPAFGGYVFEVGEGLPALPTNSTGYHFPAGAQRRRRRRSLGSRPRSASTVSRRPPPADSGVSGGSARDDGTAPALFVRRRRPAELVLLDAWATAAVEGMCRRRERRAPTRPSTSARPPSTPMAISRRRRRRRSGADERRADRRPADQPIPIEECATPEPPAGVPTADEAAAKANELLVALGEDPAAFELETYADEWNASVTAYTTLDGVRWPSGYGFGFGGEGALQWASGTLAEPVRDRSLPVGRPRHGDRPALGAERDVGLRRRRCARPSMPEAAEEPAAPDEVARATARRPPTTCRRCRRRSTTARTRRPPEPIVATLVDVKADLWWVWDADGSVWLLPAYTFTDTDGNVFTVPAVTDEYMIVVEPTIEPQPEPVPAEPIDPVGRRPADHRLRASRSADPTVLEEFVGMPLAEFEEVAKRYGFTIRVVRQDGVDLPGDDGLLRLDRVNVAVEGRRRHRDRLASADLDLETRFASRRDAETSRSGVLPVAWALACSTASPTGSTGSSSASAARVASPRPTSTR